MFHSGLHAPHKPIFSRATIWAALWALVLSTIAGLGWSLGVELFHRALRH